MNIGDSPIIKIVAGFVSQVIKFFDNAYEEGWLLYLVIGLVALLLIIILFN